MSKRLLTEQEIKNVDFLIMGIGIGLIPLSVITGLVLFIVALYLLYKDDGCKQ